MTHLAFLPPAATLRLTTASAAASPPSAAAGPFSSLASSAHLLGDASSPAALSAEYASAPPPPQVFEAVAPDGALVAAFLSVVVLCVAAGFVWANDVVPVSRTKLAISKSRGEVREYLDGLRTAESSSGDLNATTITSLDDQIADNGDERSIDDATMVKPNVGDGRDFERWLFSDWLNKPSAKGGRQKEPALPVLKDAKWNSGDNPVLVTAAIMMLGVVLASITERIAT